MKDRVKLVINGYTLYRSGVGRIARTAAEIPSEGDTMAALTNAEVTVSDAPLDVTLGSPEPK